MILEENKFEVSNSEYKDSAGKLLFDLNKYKKIYEDYHVKKHVELGKKASWAFRKAQEDYEEFVNNVLLNWSKVYLVGTESYHWVMYRIMLYNRKKYQLQLQEKYVLDGIRSATAIRKSSEDAYYKFLDEINKHIIYVPTIGGKKLSPLSGRKTVKDFSARLYYEAPDLEAEFFKAHYGGGSDALGY